MAVYSALYPELDLIGYSLNILERVSDMLETAL